VSEQLHQLEQYLHDALGVTVTATPWMGDESLPHFLKELYTYAQINLMGKRGLLVVDTNPAEQSPAAVRKHVDLLRTKQEADVIYVRNQMTAYNRKRLIEQKVPFIVPRNQMYLPMLAIDLREYFRRLRVEQPTLSPATQAVVICALLHGAEKDFIPSQMAHHLGYSAMTMTRAFDELEAASLGTVTTSGRKRCLRLAGDRQDLWTKAQPLLSSPVNTRLFICRADSGISGIRAGLSALAQYSMLAQPPYTTHALSRQDWKSLRQRHKVVEVPSQDPEAEEIEVWSYRPALFAERGIVDPFSLYLSLNGDRDERTQSALDEMMGKIKW
jgi:DNA-binding MarR family transcriptional regulator